jgi:hypothetical protein
MHWAPEDEEQGENEDEAWARFAAKGLRRGCGPVELIFAMSKPILTSLLLIAVVAGCEPCQHYNRLQVVAYAGPATKRPHGTIKPYETGAEVGRPFEVIGLLVCEASAQDETAVLKAMLYRAADMGADGIVLHPAKATAEGAAASLVDTRSGWATLVGNGSDRGYRAEAIRFKAGTP